ncbi:hypothetical protein A9K55_004707 [Cordyceps militaris]|uniref:Uncharacterized protein n=1 Tax=Cordyceps militaris TaxID=73501 RepID=A0A2H4SM00_CORMI|nr:hypothetical protein A9K55_004707 [Cordyceps militaris]
MRRAARSPLQQTEQKVWNGQQSVHEEKQYNPPPRAALLIANCGTNHNILLLGLRLSSSPIFIFSSSTNLILFSCPPWTRPTDRGLSTQRQRRAIQDNYALCTRLRTIRLSHRYAVSLMQLAPLRQTSVALPSPPVVAGLVKRYYWHLANDKHLRAQVGADSLGPDGLFACLAGFVNDFKPPGASTRHRRPNQDSNFPVGIPIPDSSFYSLSTTLFHLADNGASTHSETDPSVATVHLIGSWDNFSSSYPMDRDARRGRGHWRGCHSLQDHVCDGAGSRYRTHTGLAMGHTYYYYYELNGSTETCNPKMPSTTTCPFLPGQKLNTLYIPKEAPSRTRCASLTSLSQEQFRTMDPRAKFITPQPAAPSHADLSTRRTGTAAPALATNFVLSKERPISASSPIKSPWRRFFNKTLIGRSLESRDRPLNNNDDHRSLASTSSNYDIRPQTPSEGSRTRDISPVSLRRLLVAEIDTSVRPVSRGSLAASVHSRTPTFDVFVMEQVDEEQIDEEDDDNFGAAADELSLYAVDEEEDDNFVAAAEKLALYTVEEPLFTTRLSPPPFKRDASPATATRSSAQTVMSLSGGPEPTSKDVSTGLFLSSVPQPPFAQRSMPGSPALSVRDTFVPSACASSTLSSCMNSPASLASCEFSTLCEFPTSGDLSILYDESHDDDDVDERSPCSEHEEMAADAATAAISNHVKAPSTASFSRYRLPPLAFSADKLPAADSDASALSPSLRFAAINSPLLLPRPNGGPVGGGAGGGGGGGGSNLLSSSLVGLDDFGHELSWLVDSITSRHQS